jgi:hypothetical protein
MESEDIFVYEDAIDDVEKTDTEEEKEDTPASRKRSLKPKNRHQSATSPSEEEYVEWSSAHKQGGEDLSHMFEQENEDPTSKAIPSREWRAAFHSAQDLVNEFVKSSAPFVADLRARSTAWVTSVHDSVVTRLEQADSNHNPPKSEDSSISEPTTGSPLRFPTTENELRLAKHLLCDSPFVPTSPVLPPQVFGISVIFTFLGVLTFCRFIVRFLDSCRPSTIARVKKQKDRDRARRRVPGARPVPEQAVCPDVTLEEQRE